MALCSRLFRGLLEALGRPFVWAEECESVFDVRNDFPRPSIEGTRLNGGLIAK